MLRIKEVIKEKGITIKEVAEKLEVSPQYVSAIINNRKNPSLETLASIANVLETPLASLFDGYVKPSTITEKGESEVACPYCGNAIVLRRK